MKKKSLIDTLKATRKANVVTAPAKNEGTSTRKVKLERKTEFGRYPKMRSLN